MDISELSDTSFIYKRFGVCDIASIKMLKNFVSSDMIISITFLLLLQLNLCSPMFI